MMSLPVQSISDKHNPAHAIYIGVIQIHHLTQDSMATLEVKVFSDDLIACLQDLFPDEDCKIDQLCQNSTALITSYFQQKIQVKINQQESRFQFQSCSKEQDTHWLRFVLSCPTQWVNININSPFFMDLFPTQSNVIQIKDGDQQYFGKTSITQSSFEVECKN